MWIILIVVIFFILAGFFSGIEAGFISIDRLKFEQQAKKDKTKKKILQFLESPEKLFGTTLFGTNISIVIVSSLSMFLLNSYKNNKLSEQTATLIIAGVILVFAEIIPKALYRDFPSKLVTHGFPLLNISRLIFTPFVKFVSLLNKALSKLLKLEDKDGFNLITREDLSYMLAETKDEDTFQKHQKQMLEEVLEFTELNAENVMIHRTEIVAFNENTSIEEVIKTASKNGFTRFPVFQENLDKIVGILIIYDILNTKSIVDKIAGDFIREAYYAPENKDVNTLLLEMQAKKKSMAIVIDSFGGTAGLVTIEDILEEIVGEIEDEYDNVRTVQEVKKINANTYIVQGFVEIDFLNDDFDMNLPEGDYETIAGLIIDKLTQIPQAETTLEIGNWKIKILQATSKKIIKVKLIKQK